jgi:2-succinyl-6-hydroxy-2,4-cyclohexadiene-1-carboxylate synthase
MLHGFTQTGGCLGPVADALSADHTVVRPDLPGHGDATRLAQKDLWATASHLATAIGPTLDGPSVWFGYSFGGRVALHVALAHPEVVSGLVLVGTTAGIRDDAERAARAAADRELADHVEEVGVETFLDEWLAGPLFAGLPEEARFVEERRRNTAAGLAGSLRHAGTGAMDPLWDRLGEITVPVLLLTGAGDPKFTAIAQELAVGLPAAEVVVVADAGHAAHLEQPAAVADVVVPFCERLVPLTAARHLDPAPRWYA